MGHHEIVGIAMKSQPKWATEHIWGRERVLCRKCRAASNGPGSHKEELLLLPGGSGEPLRTLEQDSYSHVLTKDGK